MRATVITGDHNTLAGECRSHSHSLALQVITSRCDRLARTIRATGDSMMSESSVRLPVAALKAVRLRSSQAATTRDWLAVRAQMVEERRTLHKGFSTSTTTVSLQNGDDTSGRSTSAAAKKQM